MLFRLAVAMAAVMEQVKHRAEKQQKVWQRAEDVRRVLHQEIERDDDRQAG